MSLLKPPACSAPNMTQPTIFSAGSSADNLALPMLSVSGLQGSASVSQPFSKIRIYPRILLPTPLKD